VKANLPKREISTVGIIYEALSIGILRNNEKDEQLRQKLGILLN
jgi:hypothetical protein